MQITKIGELGLIKRIRKKVVIRDKKVMIGIGDDAAIFQPNANKLILVTVDMLIEKVHFNSDFFTPFQIGKRAVALNLSDIAAMGGIPKYMLVSLGLPQKTEIRFVDELYKGMRKLGDEFGMEIIGGDTVSSPERIVINITLLGEGEKKYLVLRSGATPGDAILVTGDLGASAVGLTLLNLERGYSINRCVQKYLTPFPRVKEARIIVKNKGASSMIDASDGLAREIFHLTEESKVGAEIWSDNLPISSATIKSAHMLKKNPLDFVLYGGEDLELVFTAPQKKVDFLLKEVPSLTKTSLTVIGKITDKKEEVKLVDKNGQIRELKNKGYEHFKCINGNYKESRRN